MLGWGLGFRFWGFGFWGFGVWGLGFGVWILDLGLVLGLGVLRFWVLGVGFGIWVWASDSAGVSVSVNVVVLSCLVLS